MKTWSVEVERTVTQRAVIEVRAATATAARRAAIAELNEDDSAFENPDELPVPRVASIEEAEE